ncbi:MAG: site-2 protease family protein [Anaerolineae bacterium]
MSTDSTQHLLAIASEVMAVEEFSVLSQPQGAVRFQGRLLAAPGASHAAISERLRPLGYIAMLERRNGRDVATFLLHAPVTYRPRPRLALALLLLTILSTLFVGATMVEPDLPTALHRPLSGLPFAISLLTALGVHEMGHYLVARRYEVQVSLPYFIPMPLGPFGTMGAFISMKSPPLNKRHLLRIGLAGPLSGLLVALVVTVYGLSQSKVGIMPAGVPFYREGNSIAYMLLKYWVFGLWLPQGNVDVNLSPVAFAGWAGLLVTGLNLIPAAQLDGGHIAYALLGRRARLLTIVLGMVLLVMGLLWPGWLLWALIILYLGARREVVLDEITPLTVQERLVAVLMLLVFCLLFVPVPLTIG